jgi:hypothetical protein
MQNLVMFARRNANLAVAFISGFLLPVATNLASSWLEQAIGENPARLIQLVALLLAATIGLWVLARVVSLDRRHWVIVEREQQPEPMPGLIVLLGPGREGQDPLKTAAVPAIQHHLAGGALKVCWLLYSTAAIGLMEAIRDQYAGRLKIIPRPVKDEWDVEDTFRIVRQVYLQEAPAEGLSAEQVIADFTGGTRIMTAGMVLACGEQWPMQYFSRKPGTQLETSTPLRVEFHPPAEPPPQA